MANTRDNRDLRKNDYLHIYNRGNHYANIFHDKADYLTFLDIIFDYFHRYNQEILAYCLIPNHYHLFVKVLNPSEFTRCMQLAFSRITFQYNLKYNLVGSLCQDKYKHRKVVGYADHLAITRYIHRNPIEDRDLKGRNIIDELLDYEWSSFRQYLGFTSKKHQVNDYLVPKSLLEKQLYIEYCSKRAGKMEKKLQIDK